MRAITKGAEPASLTAHRKRPHSTYENYRARGELRQALVTEQRGLCCYCMGRIQSGSNQMKVEHWRCKDRFTDEQLQYNNLLGACRGGEGSPLSMQHCDTRKRNQDLRWNPANPDHRIESRLIYDPDGTIRAEDSVFNNHLNRVLNLNLARLKNNRKGVLTAVLEWWKASRPVSVARIRREIRRRTEGVGHLQPFCQVAVWWLSKKIKT